MNPKTLRRFALLAVVTLMVSACVEDPSGTIPAAPETVESAVSSPYRETQWTMGNLDLTAGDSFVFLTTWSLDRLQLAVTTNRRTTSVLIPSVDKSAPFSVRTGYLDGDLLEEIVVAYKTLNGQAAVAVWEGRFDQSGNMSLHEVASLSLGACGRGCNPVVTTGNFDDEHQDEIAVALEDGSDRIALLTYELQHYVLGQRRLVRTGDRRIGAPGFCSDPNRGDRRCKPYIESVDHDANGLDDIALSFEEAWGGKTIQWYRGDGLELRAGRTWDNPGHRTLSHDEPILLRAANYVGDAGDEIAMYYTDDRGRRILRIANPYGDQLHQVGNTLRMTGAYDRSVAWLGAFDSDNDGYPEPHTLYRYSGNFPKANVTGWDINFRTTPQAIHSFRVDWVQTADLGLPVESGTAQWGMGFVRLWEVTSLSQPRSQRNEPQPPAPAPQPQPDQDGCDGIKSVTVALDQGVRPYLENAIHDGQVPDNQLCGQARVVSVRWTHPDVDCASATVTHDNHGAELTRGASSDEFDRHDPAGTWRVQPNGNDCDGVGVGKGGNLVVQYRF